MYRLGLVLAELHVGPGHTVLDFGAGSCWLSAFLNRLRCRTIAVDVSATALRLGEELFALDPRQRRELPPRFLHYDGHRLPLPDGSVDRVVAFDAFHHVANPAEVLAELCRVLSTGGRAVFSEPGDGHARAPHTRLEVERFGILERKLRIEDVAAEARAAGFTQVLMKPYADPAAILVSAEEYARVVAGEDGAYPMAVHRDSLRDVHMYVLLKGEERRDSRFPGELRAALESAPGTLRGARGDRLAIPLRVTNLGDTFWRHESDECGGYVRLGVHLCDARGAPSVWDYHRVPLPQGVAPGESVELFAEIPLPDARGRHRLKLDMVDEEIAWFEAHGSAPLELEIDVD